MMHERRVRSGTAWIFASFFLAYVLPCTGASTTNKNYQVPTAAELEDGEQLFNLLFARESLNSARIIARDLGLSWQETEFGITLIDKENRGWGEYHFGRSADSDVVIQVPHRYSDLHTGKIAMQVFSGGGINSIALNSVSRRTPVSSQPGLAADLAHLPESFHSAHSRAFSMRYPQGRLVHLHGFSAKKRRSAQGRNADAIISTGSSWSSAYLLETQQCFESRGWNTLRYPQQVRELGGTTNSIGVLMRNLGHGGFTHVELNLKTRKSLRRNPGQIAAFASCLLGAAQ